MNVTRLQILRRGLRIECPNCGRRTLFKEGTLFTLNNECPACRLKLEKDEGFFLGSMSINYGVTVVCFLCPVLYLAYKGVIGTTTAVVLAGIGAIGFPALFYRASRSIWLMQYYFFLPQHLPANREEGGSPEDDENT